VTASKGLRRLLHGTSTLLLLVVPLFGVVAMRWVLVGTAVLACALEVVRLHSPTVRHAVERLLPVFRPHEARGPTGATWLAIGYALAGLLPWPGAQSGVLVGGLADPAASLVGGRWGKDAANTKTAVGSAAFFAVATAVLLASGVPAPVALAGGATTSVAERFSGRIDDNLIVPVVAAVVVLILT
jgi:dolichol kinase